MTLKAESDVAPGDNWAEAVIWEVFGVMELNSVWCCSDLFQMCRLGILPNLGQKRAVPSQNLKHRATNLISLPQKN